MGETIMPFERIIKKPHRCSMPTGYLCRKGGSRYGAGTIWRCPSCGKRYMLADSPAVGLMWYELMPEEEERPENLALARGTGTVPTKDEEGGNDESKDRVSPGGWQPGM